MARTNIDIDEDLIATVMSQNGLTTKREAVDFALRKAVRRPVTRDELAQLEGSGFALSLEEIRPGDAHRSPR